MLRALHLVRRLPNPFVCYGFLFMISLVPEALYIDPGYSPPHREVLIHYSIALLFCVMPLGYYLLHRWTIHSIVCASLSALMLCFAALVIIRSPIA